MSLKSRYRLMRMRSRLSSGRARRRVLMALLLIAGAFVMLAGLIMVILVACAAAVFVVVLFIWSLFSRRGHQGGSGADHGSDSGSGVTLEGEYTVEHEHSAVTKEKP